MIWRLWKWNRLSMSWTRTEVTKVEGESRECEQRSFDTHYWFPASTSPVGRKPEDFEHYKSIPGQWQAGSGRPRPE